MKANWTKKTLIFKQPANTSRGVMNTRDIWLITLSRAGITGIGECAPLPRLSLDEFNQIETKLNEICRNIEKYLNDMSFLSEFPSIRFGLEMAYLDLQNGNGQYYFGDFDTIKINGLIWMGDPDFVIEQVEQKLAEGWKCIKMKIGALEFEQEVEILRTIRSRFNNYELEFRVDANGAFKEKDVFKKLDKLSEFELHSIEQPIKSGHWELLAKICQTSPVPIALDEELIPLVRETDRIEMLDKVQPQYLVLKPSLLGGFAESEKWIQLAKERNIGWWITSALESNIGLNAIAQWTKKMQPDGFQGLGTGQLYYNNFPSPLRVKSGVLDRDESPIWKDVQQFMAEWFNADDEIFLQTSGSTGKPKSISVKKEWLKNSAKLTANTFGLKTGDSALLCLPMKYIAGKMMVVRALELGLNLKVVEPSSKPLEGLDDQIDFAAMVPLQLENSIDQLKKVKTLIVGGGQVNRQLAEKLQSVSTQVYETYGMTETLTHVAIKPLNGPNKSDVFHALDEIYFEIDERWCLVIHAPILNPEPVVTNDLVDLIDKKTFRWLGRFDNVINSGGVKIIPEVVEAKLAEAIPDRRYFVAGFPDEQLGQKVVLVVEGEVIEIKIESLEKYEHSKAIYFLTEFIETESGKINRTKTIEYLKTKLV